MDELNAIENAIRWDYVQENFERDRFSMGCKNRG